MDVTEKIYEIVKSIPRGKVMTYGAIAKQTGASPRIVGNVLHKNPDPGIIPCHRIVNVKGKIAENYAFGGLVVQKKKLKAEGVKFRDSAHVDLVGYLWESC